MIWYLLYPFRGTTEPPKLAHSHPLRRVFTRHGNATARHWQLSIIVSVVTAWLLCYPVLFLYEPSSAASYALPHHVWASARLCDESATTRADIEVRQVWVHGSYMSAINKDVLTQALAIQDSLIGAAYSQQIGNGSSITFQEPVFEAATRIYHDACKEQRELDVSWGFHSPLMYWNCSLEALETDVDILNTINRQTHRQSFLKFTLRPTSVFAGKVFSGHKIKAADALVITLISRAGFRAGLEWDRRSIELARTAADYGWSFYPETGASTRTQLYQFRIQPLSLNDDFFLAVSYFLMAVYVVVSLRKLRAVKSRFGLVLTVISQITISILASFTICGLLKINLAQIPQEAYPFVVLVIGLENMFRLINAVLANPPEMPTLHRISHALGDVGHLSLAAAGQNLFLLWMLSRIVSPGVAAFCAFAAVALVFDFVFHLTFFVAVLSVDVRRMELQDSLDRVNSTPRRAKSPHPERRQAWGEALLQGNLPFSTRIAGSAVTICFVLALNWHFFDGEKQGSVLFNLFGLGRHREKIFMDTPSPPPINQARTPSAWLKLQGQDNAREVISFVKPKTHSFFAKIYEPLTVVLKDADRTGAPSPAMSLLTGFWDLVDEHIFPFAMAVVFIIAIITLLMNYLLWHGLPDDDEDFEGIDEPVLSIRNLPKTHALDVVKLTSCNQGHMISISLDRSTSIWTLDTRTNMYSNALLRTAAMTPKLWPIVACTIGRCSQFLALCTESGKAAIWNCDDRRFVRFADIDLHGFLPTTFELTLRGVGEPLQKMLIVITPDGNLTEVDVDPSVPPRCHQISSNPLYFAMPYFDREEITRVLSAHRNGDLFLSARILGEWSSRRLPGFGPRLTQSGHLSKVKHMLTAKPISAIAIVRNGEVDLISAATYEYIHTFRVGPSKGHGLRLVYSELRQCPSCHSSAVHSLSLVYTDPESQVCIMQTYTNAKANDALICFRSDVESEKDGCKGFERATETVHMVERPGVWEATKVQAIIGIRKRRSPAATSPDNTHANGKLFPAWSSSTASGLKNRTLHPGQITSPAVVTTSSSAHPATYHTQTMTPASNAPPDTDSDDWEAWTLSSSGEFHSTPLLLSPRHSLDPTSAFAPLSSRTSSSSFMPFRMRSAKPFTAETTALTHDDDQLFVTKPGPIAQLGMRSVAVGLGNAVKIITLGTERFEPRQRQGETVGGGRGRRKGPGRKVG